MNAPHGALLGAHRPAPLGTRGMVCSSHYLASLAGISTLQAGGNAVDAAIAVAAVLGLVEPHMSGPGGDGFLMLYSGETGRVSCLNGTGKAPSRAERALFADGIPYKGIRSVSVPGLVAAWVEAHQNAGALPLAQVVAPARAIAEQGFPVSPKLAAALEAEAAAGSLLFSHPASADVFAPQGRPLRAGELCRSPDYARTLDRIAAEGAEAFYCGPIGAAILELSRAQDGLFEPDDLREHRAFWQEPIATTYRGYEVLEYPPNSSGHVLLQELNLVEHFDLRALGLLSPESIHVMVEAKKLAFADRERYLADPDWVRVPIERLLSKEYAADRVRLINPERAAVGVPAGRIADREETTCFCTADGQGNAVCQLQSIQSAFGSGLIVPGTGVLLNNRMTYWHLEPGHPDELRPGKRVRHTMNPYMVRRDGRLVLVGGTPGADTQVQTNLQVISHVLDFGADVQEAVEAPRWRHTQNGTESEYPHTCPDELILEDRFPEATRRALEAKGHPLRIIDAWAASGSQQMIALNPETGVLSGGSDPRRDSAALAW
jgi:gamma-glutamyltranspeptidase